MKRYFLHHPLFRLLGPPVYGVLVYLLVLLLNNHVGQINDIFSGEEVYLCIGLTYLSFESMRLVMLGLRRWLPGLRLGLHLLWQVACTTAVSVLLIICMLRLYFEWRVGFSISHSQLLLFTALFTGTALLYNLLYFSHYYLQQENTMKLQAEKQQRDALEREMLAFKNDINPDLLYESLESLINLLYRDVEQAEEYIDCLATAYRYVLTHRRQELVTTAQEIEATKNLVRLLNEKHFGQLRFETNLEPDELDALLIPGSLPVIIESIVRNTIISRFEPLVIRCYREDDYLTVQSKLNDRLVSHPASDHALTRLQKSYGLYSDQPMIQVKAYEENYIKLPVLRLGEEVYWP